MLNPHERHAAGEGGLARVDVGDGFIAGPEHAMDWIFEYDEAIPMADEVMNATGAITRRP